MIRRKFLKYSAAGLLAPGLAFKVSHATKTHLISLSFDDGFRKSFLKLADIHEEYGLRACLNVIASGHFKTFQAVDDWILPELMGDFDDWNRLVVRGHEVMPHSWAHNNLAKMEAYEAKKLISKCIVYFNENLMHFKPKTAVFNFPFNSSTLELDQHALTLVRAVRTQSNGAINPLPNSGIRILGCASNGPGNIDSWVEERIAKFLAMEGGWLILNLHGLDNEGWGSISTDFLTSLLGRLINVRNLDIIPVGMALQKYA